MSQTAAHLVDHMMRNVSARQRKLPQEDSASLAMPDADAVVKEALALRGSHPQAPAAIVLDLVWSDRGVWLEDLFEHMEPPSPFAWVAHHAMS